jgi:uncharacterized membrane protein YfcA
MTEFVVAVVAGFGAGLMNSVVGAGTLISFPAMLAIGLPPLSANVTSAVGIFPGNVSAAWTYRAVLRRPEMRSISRLATIAIVAGAFMGVPLLLLIPPAVFSAVVPWLILTAGVLTLAQPWIARAFNKPQGGSQPRRFVIVLGLTLAGIYLSYFGAATGVLVISALLYAGISDLQSVNAVKNFAVGIANTVVAVVFIFVAPVNIPIAAMLALGALAGGYIGGRSAQRLSPTIFRLVIVAVAVLAAALSFAN